MFLLITSVQDSSLKKMFSLDFVHVHFTDLKAFLLYLYVRISEIFFLLLFIFLVGLVNALLLLNFPSMRPFLSRHCTHFTV
jgi:hypothetical protein